MLVLHVRFEEIITIGSDMEMRVMKNSHKSIIFELTAPTDTLVVSECAMKKVDVDNLILFNIKYGDQICINNSIQIKIFKVNNHTNFKFCIDAPREISIFREKTRKKMEQDGISWKSKK